METKPHKPRSRKWTRVAGIGVALILFLTVCEAGIRYTGLYATLSEKTGGGFLSLFEPTHTGALNTHVPGRDIHIANQEFVYTHRIDRLGFRNDSVPASGDTCGILALGDSFTEGLGAPQDSTWPALLARFSGQRVYNAGIMGSDPVYGLRLLQQGYFPFPYRKVVFAVNFSDLTDVVIRGGAERFLSDGTIRYHKPPLFMPVYRYSHTFRAFLHLVLGYDYMFNPPREREQRLNEALDTLTAALAEADKFCKSRGIQLAVYIHPVPQEYYMRLDRRLNFRKIDELEPRLREKGVDVMNLRPYFTSVLRNSEDWKAVSWSVDGHFNGKGYALMAQVIAKDSPPEGLLDVLE